MSRGLKSLLFVLGVFALTAGATVVEIAYQSHRDRPVLGSVVSLALLNINAILLLVLVLLIGRQLVRFYFERRQSVVGAGFRSKIIIAFIGLSIVPAGIMFIIASTLLTGGVKYWFGPRVESTMRQSIALVDSYKDERSLDAVRSAGAIAGQIGQGRAEGLVRLLDKARETYGLDVADVYDAKGVRAAISGPPAYSSRGTGKRLVTRALTVGRSSAVEDTKDGSVILGAAAYYGRDGKPLGAVVAGYFLSPAMAGSISDINRYYHEYWNLRTFKNPLKESYILSFMLVTLVIVFAAVWFGLYISKSISGPVATLAEATHKISRGDYDFQVDIEARDEIGVLVDSFRRMTHDLKGSQERLREANVSLQKSYDLLEQRRQFIETVLESVNTGVITIDRAGRISTVNRAAERITGLDESGIVGKSYREVFEFHQLEEIREQIRHMAETGTAAIEKDIQLKLNRRTLNLRLFISTLQDTTGGYLGILVVFDDLTELIKAQRAAAWKEVARRIAHEVKNPLTPIQLSAQRLRKRLVEGKGMSEDIVGECTETIITQVEGMKRLVDEFSKFARMPEAEPAPNDLHAIIDEVATLYTGAHKDITINRDYDRSLPVVNVDKEQIKRVFMNLFDNAVTAMEGRGNIWVKTEHDKVISAAVVEVADEGTGILPEDREKLFQPYFSKKKSGTGLGLAIVNRIISDHEGYIRVEGNNPRGAKFIIELPVRG